MIVIQPENPYSKEEILSCLAILQKEVDLFFSDVNPNYFYSHSLGGWSPGENLSHISFATNVLALSLKLPKLYYRLFYGKPKKEKPFLEWQSLYQETMKFPVDAGFYSPALVDSPKDKVSQIQIQSREWNTACLSLTSSLKTFRLRTIGIQDFTYPIWESFLSRDLLFADFAYTPSLWEGRRKAKEYF